MFALLLKYLNTLNVYPTSAEVFNFLLFLSVFIIYTIMNILYMNARSVEVIFYILQIFLLNNVPS